MPFPNTTEASTSQNETSHTGRDTAPFNPGHSRDEDLTAMVGARHPNEIFSYTDKQADNITMGMGIGVVTGFVVGGALLWRSIMRAESAGLNDSSPKEEISQQRDNQQRPQAHSTSRLDAAAHTNRSFQHPVTVIDDSELKRVMRVISAGESTMGYATRAATHSPGGRTNAHYVALVKEDSSLALVELGRGDFNPDFCGGDPQLHDAGGMTPQMLTGIGPILVLPEAQSLEAPLNDVLDRAYYCFTGNGGKPLINDHWSFLLKDSDRAQAVTPTNFDLKSLESHFTTPTTEELSAALLTKAIHDRVGTIALEDLIDALPQDFGGQRRELQRLAEIERSLPAGPRKRAAAADALGNDGYLATTLGRTLDLFVPGQSAALRVGEPAVFRPSELTAVSSYMAMIERYNRDTGRFEA